LRYEKLEMSRVAFDTHAAANRFRRAGFTDDQVEALVDVARETVAFMDRPAVATHESLKRRETTRSADAAPIVFSIHSESILREIKQEVWLARLDANFDRLERKIVTAQIQTIVIFLTSFALIVAVFRP
jgi:hypothetical protein